MRTELLDRQIKYHTDYGFEGGSVDSYEYACPCGNGKIVEEHDNTPGYRDHIVWIQCKKCSKKYKLDTSNGVYKWELYEIIEPYEKRWKYFLEKLNKEKEFDKSLIGYLSAIKYIAEIKVESIDNIDTREEINEKVKCIVDFIETYKNDYYEISLIKGFKLNSRREDGKWVIDGRDYYYYIADQKMKASVYYVRYLNFIYNYLGAEEEAENELERYKDIIKSKIDNEENIYISNENIISIIDDRLDLTDENLELRRKCIDYVEKIKVSSDIDYLKYMLFNNMMREIQFIGASYQYLWHWEKSKKTIYRSGSLNSISPATTIKSKSDYLKKMFQESIDHMNSPSNIRHSYSENLLIDIFKYLILPLDAVSENNIGEINSEEGIHIEYDCCLNNKSVQFEIIKDADINCIFVDENPISFYQFAVDDNLNTLQDFPFTVEMYPQTLIGEKNEKGTTKHLRDDYLPSYFKTWGISCGFSKTKVADDKEVITYGKTYSANVNLDYGSIPVFENCQSGTMLSMTLDKEDILFLILKIGLKKFESINKIVEILFDNKHITWNDTGFSSAYNNCSECVIKLTCQSIGKEVSGVFDIAAKIGEYYLKSLLNDNGNRMTLDEARKRVKSIIVKNMSKKIVDKYNQILARSHEKIDFVLSTITEKDYNFDLVRRYTEYMIGIEDKEIALLKQIVFKE